MLTPEQQLASEIESTQKEMLQALREYRDLHVRFAKAHGRWEGLRCKLRRLKERSRTEYSAL